MCELVQFCGTRMNRTSVKEVIFQIGQHRFKSVHDVAVILYYTEGPKVTIQRERITTVREPMEGTTDNHEDE